MQLALRGFPIFFLRSFPFCLFLNEVLSQRAVFVTRFICFLTYFPLLELAIVFVNLTQVYGRNLSSKQKSTTQMGEEDGTGGTVKLIMLACSISDLYACGALLT